MASPGNPSRSADPAAGLMPAGAVFAGDYRIVRPLSKGGMGAVYVAEQISTQRQRALKLMHARLVADASLRARFAQEARIGGQIPSDHVVEVQAAGVDPETGLPYLVMELLVGQTLHAAVSRHGPMGGEAFRLVLEQLCHAVGAAHAAAIVHRDLKPQNVFLADTQRTDVTFTVKVLDFGIAKLLSDQPAATAALGTPLWLAPEQAQRGPVTPATDVWALGLIAFYVLTGTVFWRAGMNPHAAVASVINELLLEPLPPASERAAERGRDLPPGFDAWFARCVARSAPERFPDATRAFAALAPLLRAGWEPAPVARSTAGAPPAMTSATQFATNTTAAGTALAVKRRRIGWALGCIGLGAVAASVLVGGAVVVAGGLWWSRSSGHGDAAPGTSAEPAEASRASAAPPSPEAAPEPGEGASPSPAGTAPATTAGPSPKTPKTPTPRAASPSSAGQGWIVAAWLQHGTDPSLLPPNADATASSIAPQLAQCHRRGALPEPETLDYFGLRVTLDASGRITSVRNSVDDPHPGVVECAIPYVRALRFAPPPKGPIEAYYQARYMKPR